MDAVDELIARAGFDCVGSCDAAGLRVHAEVRAMCAAGNCSVYGTSWACPPACGELSDFEEQMHRFGRCTVVQTVIRLEDEFDGEAMMEAQALHKERFRALVDAIDAQGRSGEAMALSAGTCELCPQCTWPDEPCRFPSKRLVSMEAAGLLVSEVCAQASIPYNHGPLTLAYSSCVLHEIR